MIYVHLSSPTNSTIFTNCCRVAITDNEIECPHCKAEVMPGKYSTVQQRSSARWNWAYHRDQRARNG